MLERFKTTPSFAEALMVEEAVNVTETAVWEGNMTVRVEEESLPVVMDEQVSLDKLIRVGGVVYINSD